MPARGSFTNYVAHFAALVALSLILGSGCTGSPQSRQRADFSDPRLAPLEHIGSSHTASNLGYIVEITPELFVGVNPADIMDPPRSVQFYSYPMDAPDPPIDAPDAGLKYFPGLHRWFFAEPVQRYDARRMKSRDLDSNAVAGDAKCEEVTSQLFARLCAAVASAEWILDPALLHDSNGFIKTDAAPLCELYVELKWAESYADRKYGVGTGKGATIKLGVYYKRDESKKRTYEPVVFMFSSRTTVKLFAFSQSDSKEIHDLAIALSSRISDVLSQPD